MPTLGINIDHIAAVRQLREGKEPDPIQAAVLAEIAGAGCISTFIHEDRRHIKDRDIYLLKQTVTSHLNLELTPSSDLMQLALDVGPYMVTLVPENYEGKKIQNGLNIRGKERDYAKIIDKFLENNILVSLFIDAEMSQIKAVPRTGATHIEMNTGHYARSSGQAREDELGKLEQVGKAAQTYGLIVNAGFGLNYLNVSTIAKLEDIDELHIGHSIIARSFLIGLDRAVRDMLTLL